MNQPNPDLITLTVEILDNRFNAILVSNGTKEVWLPKKFIHHQTETTITIHKLTAKEKGLI